MVTWNNKLITVLSGGNLIKFSNYNDFNEFKWTVRLIGLDISKYTYGEILNASLYDAERHNRKYELGDDILVGYDNGTGIQIGWKSEKAAEEWFGLKPFTWAEIKEELK